MEHEEKNEKECPGGLRAGKALLQILDVGFSVLYKFAVGAGALVLLIYFASIGFYPALNVSEVVLLVFMTVMFGVVYVVTVGYGALSAFWVISAVEFSMRLYGRARENPGVERRKKLRRKVLEKKRSRVSFLNRGCSRLRGFMRRRRQGRRAVRSMRPAGIKGLLPALLSILAFGVFLLVFLVREETRGFIAGAFVAGFILLSIAGSILRDGDPTPLARKAIAKRLFIALLGSTIVFMGVAGAFVPTSLTLTKLGLRSMNMTVEVSDAELKRLALVSETLDFPVVDCRAATKGSVLLHYVDVLWHGVGDKSRLSFAVPGERKRLWDLSPAVAWKEASLSIDSKSTSILAARPRVASCIPYSSAYMFDAGDAAFSARGRRTMDSLSKVVGRADSSRTIDLFFFVPAADALALGESRADALARQLEGALSSPEYPVTVSTRVRVGEAPFQLLPSSDIEIWVGGAPHDHFR